MTVKEFKNAALCANDLNKEQFTKLLNDGFKLAGITIEEFAESLKISTPTAYRWLKGDSAPHRLGRKPVIDWLVKNIGV